MKHNIKIQGVENEMIYNYTVDSEKYPTLKLIGVMFDDDIMMAMVPYEPGKGKEGHLHSDWKLKDKIVADEEFMAELEAAKGKDVADDHYGGSFMNDTNTEIKKGCDLILKENPHGYLDNVYAMHYNISGDLRDLKLFRLHLPTLDRKIQEFIDENGYKKFLNDFCPIDNYSFEEWVAEYNYPFQFIIDNPAIRADNMSISSYFNYK